MQLRKETRNSKCVVMLPKHEIGSTNSWQPGRLVLAQHFAVAQVFVLVYHHTISLGGDIEDDIGFLAIFVHGSLVVGEGSLAVLMFVVVVEELAETLDTDAAKDTKYVALMFVELWYLSVLQTVIEHDWRSYLVVPRGSKQEDRREGKLVPQSDSSE